MPACDQHFFSRSIRRNLAIRMCVVNVVSVRQVRHQAVNLQTIKGFQCIEKRGQVSQRYAITPHPRVYFKMHFERLPQCLAGCLLQSGGGFEREKRGRELMLNDFGGLLGPRPTEAKDGLCDARRAQLDGFFDQGDREPIRASFGQHWRTTRRAVTVSISFNDRHQLRRRSKRPDVICLFDQQLLDRAAVGGKARQRNFYPSGS